MEKARKIVGWILSIVVSGIFLMGAFVQLSHNPRTVASFEKLGYPDWLSTFLGVSFLVSLLLHLVPRTAFALLGAILFTAFFGGIIATHLVLGDGQWWSRVIFGVMPWLGLYLRDARFNDLMSFWRGQKS